MLTVLYIRIDENIRYSRYNLLSARFVQTNIAPAVLKVLKSIGQARVFFLSKGPVINTRSGLTCGTKSGFVKVFIGHWLILQFDVLMALVGHLPVIQPHLKESRHRLFNLLSKARMCHSFSRSKPIHQILFSNYVPPSSIFLFS